MKFEHHPSRRSSGCSGCWLRRFLLGVTCVMPDNDGLFVKAKSVSSPIIDNPAVSVSIEPVSEEPFLRRTV